MGNETLYSLLLLGVGGAPTKYTVPVAGSHLSLQPFQWRLHEKKNKVSKGRAHLRLRQLPEQKTWMSISYYHYWVRVVLKSRSTILRFTKVHNDAVGDGIMGMDEVTLFLFGGR